MKNLICSIKTQMRKVHPSITVAVLAMMTIIVNIYPYFLGQRSFLHTTILSVFIIVLFMIVYITAKKIFTSDSQSLQSYERSPMRKWGLKIITILSTTIAVFIVCYSYLSEGLSTKIIIYTTLMSVCVIILFIIAYRVINKSISNLLEKN
jgi:peptidoglycan/LPS O-acetylase OafA/YrhL